MPFFSIIIPTFNRAHLIKETILSVQNQTFTDWECIVIDDGSTDNTKEVIKELTKIDKRIRYIYQENAERSAARNNGISNAKGEYICFLDSDDWYEKDNLLNWYLFWESSNIKKGIAYCGMKKITNESEAIIHEINSNQNTTYFLLNHPIIPARICIHHELLIKHKFELDCIICEDICLWMKLAEKYPILSSNHIGAIYHIHDENSINPKTPAHLKLYTGLNNFFNRNQIIKKQIAKNDYNDFMSRVETNIAQYYFLNTKRLQALKYLIKAIFRSPINKRTKHRIYLLIKTIYSRNPNLYE